MAGSEGISVADIAAHFDLVGIIRPRERRRIYRQIVGLEQERRRLINSDSTSEN